MWDFRRKWVPSVGGPWAFRACQHFLATLLPNRIQHDQGLKVPASVLACCAGATCLPDVSQNKCVFKFLFVNCLGVCILLPEIPLHGIQPPGFCALHSRAHTHLHLKEGCWSLCSLKSTRKTRSVKPLGLEVVKPGHTCLSRALILSLFITVHLQHCPPQFLISIV